MSYRLYHSTMYISEGIGLIPVTLDYCICLYRCVFSQYVFSIIQTIKILIFLEWQNVILLYYSLAAVYSILRQSVFLLWPCVAPLF